MEFSKRDFRRRFNLVELILVVTATVGIASLVLPIVYNSLREAQGMNCANNLKTLGSWAVVYTSQNNNMLPPYEFGWVKALSKAGGRDLDPGKAPAKEWACPSQKHVSYGADISPDAWWRGSHFGINQHLASALRLQDGSPMPHWTDVDVRKIRSPAEKALMADASGGNVFGIKDRDPVIAGISSKGRTYVESIPPDPVIGFPYLRHSGGSANFLFLDMHVASLTVWPEFMLGRGSPGFDFWHGEHWYAEQGIPNPDAPAVPPAEGNPATNPAAPAGL